MQAIVTRPDWRSPMSRMRSTEDFEPVQQAPGVRQELAADRGQCHMAGGPLEQRHAQHLLQLLQPSAERGLRQVQRVRRLVEAAHVGDRHEGAQVLKIEIFISFPHQSRRSLQFTDGSIDRSIASDRGTHASFAKTRSCRSDADHERLLAHPRVLMRGGTSRGPFFLASDLPADPQRATGCWSMSWAPAIRWRSTASAAAIR